MRVRPTLDREPVDCKGAARSVMGPVVTLICDGGERYAGTYYNDAWLAAEDMDIAPALARLQRIADTGGV